ncbi:predicted protein [Botrytis cinerea T4]|uniref:Uncharacterized protein n=1 Tax=Botryotinia fuckeliana (strain T4) TaxID=999810 RepID=G2YAL3_BOTF4|nr:predicted protein [Botrytis cinerea T4]
MCPTQSRPCWIMRPSSWPKHYLISVDFEQLNRACMYATRIIWTPLFQRNLNFSLCLVQTQVNDTYCHAVHKHNL